MKILSLISPARVAAVVLSLTCVATFGCSKRFSDLPTFSAFPIHDFDNESVGPFKTSYLADQIHAYYRGHSNGPVAVTTFVDIDDLYGASTFGRMISEQLMSELAMRGYNVVEIRHSEAMQILDGQGEFGLSRDVNALRPYQDLSGIIVGTYVASPERIYVNARLINPSTSVVMSAGTVEMAKTSEISRMLRTSVLPPSLERIPVRTMGTQQPATPYWGWPQQQQPAPYGVRPTEEDSYAVEPGKGNDVPAPKAKDGEKKADADKKEAPSPTLEPTT